MSYIDSYDHEYIGTLGYLPIYRPLQEFNGNKWGHYDFNASPNNLVLGGGNGERPGLVIHKLECLAAIFLYEQLTDDEEEQLSDIDSEYIENLICEAHENIFEFCGWSIRDYASFTQMAKSASFMTPLGEDEEVEDWLCQSLGELIYFSLPDLNPDHARLESIFKNFAINATRRNVLCSPPGYPACGGRKVINGEPIFGIHRWNLTP